MSKQRIVKDEIWDDEWFYDLDPSEKLVWLFLLTNQRNNIAGVYQLNRRWGANSVGLDRDVFEVIIKRFEQDTKISLFEEWIVILNFHKHQSHNPKVEAGVKRILEELPKEIIVLLPIDSLCIAYPTLLNSTLLNLSVTEPSSEDNKKKMKKNKFGSYNENSHTDTFEDEVQVDPDYTPVKKKEKKAPDQIQQVFDLFSNPARVTWRLRELERVAAQALFDTYGIEKLKVRIDRIEAEKNNKDPLFPLVTCPSQLLDKMPNVERYFGI